MTALTEKIYNEVLDLPNDERVSLIDKLLHVIPRLSSNEIEQAWMEESHKRWKDIQSGNAESIPAEEVFLEIQKRFK